MRTFIRGLRIWFAMFPKAQWLAREWYPTFKEFKERHTRLKE
jgi:type IV secretory pathway TrbD component